MNHLITAGNTDPGKRRKENQDAFVVRQLWTADKALVAVIDGVGGYTGGEKAASIAKECLGQYMQIPRGDTLTMLREAVIFANNRIVEERNNDKHFSEMCCVLTAVVTDVSENCFYYAHVGDTRLYRYRGGKLEKITRDHSIVGIKEDAGDLTELEAMNHPHRNQILREVGSTSHRLDDEDFLEYGREELLPEDVLLLCSDGLTDMVTANQVTTLLSVNQDLSTKTDNLIALANEMGGADNITVVLLQYQPATRIVETPKENVLVEERIMETPAVPVSKKRRRFYEKSRFLWVALLIALFAGAGWYLSPRKKAMIDLPGEVIPVKKTEQAWDGSRALLPRREHHPAIPGPMVEQKLDTIRIAGTQRYEHLRRYADSSGKTIVLLPGRKFQAGQPAVDITSASVSPGDTLLLRNLQIKGFETGFRVRVPLIINTENLVFENVRYPFSYPIKKDSQFSSVLIMNQQKQ